MQFDVYANDNPASAEEFPFLLDIQNDLLKSLATRIIVPLTPQTKINRPLGTIQPVVAVGGETMIALFDETTSYPAALLGKTVTNLSGYREVFLQAYDFLIQGY